MFDKVLVVMIFGWLWTYIFAQRRIANPDKHLRRKLLGKRCLILDVDSVLNTSMSVNLVLMQFISELCFCENALVDSPQSMFNINNINHWETDIKAQNCILIITRKFSHINFWLKYKLHKLHKRLWNHNLK